MAQVEDSVAFLLSWKFILNFIQILALTQLFLSAHNNLYPEIGVQWDEEDDDYKAA